MEERIQDYVEGSLPEAERVAVEQAIANDPKLAQMADQYQKIFKGLRLNRVTEIEKALLAQDENHHNTKGNKSGLGKWTWLGLGLVAVASLIAFAFFQFSRYSNASLADQYFKKPLDPRVAGANEDTKAYFNALDNFYDDNYAEAVEGFSELQSSNVYGSIASFYLPHALFLAGDYTAANDAFQAALKIEDLQKPDQELLQWNAMISALKLNKNIHSKLDREWSRIFPAEQLESSLNSIWHLE